jgi:ABC-2 type transport system permease protein
LRLGEVFRFELAYTTRRVTTWIYAAVLFGIAYALLNGNAARGVADANAPAILAMVSIFVGFFGILVSAALFGDAAVRDVDAGMDPLLFTSSLGKSEYLGGRFLAALTVNAVVLVAIPLGLVAATLTYRGPGQVGPFHMGAYLQPFVLFLLPNLAVVGTVMFSIGTLARQVIPVYFGGIGLFIGYLIALNLGSPIENAMLAALADPLGLSALLNMTGFWTAAERNTQFIGFPAMLVWSRVFWLAVAAAVLAGLHWRFRFAHPSTRFRLRAPRYSGQVARSGLAASTFFVRLLGGPLAPSGVEGPAPNEVEGLAPERATRVEGLPRVAIVFGLKTRMWQALAVARCSLEDIAGSRAFVVAILVAIGLVLLWGWNIGDTAFDTSTWPVTFLVAEAVLGLRIQPVVFLLIAVFAGELVWKDRDAGVAEIADAAPVPEGVALLGRFVALVAILATFQVVFMAGGVVLQTLLGYYRFDPALYLRILFGLHFVDQVLLAALAMTVHVLVNQKYVGHIVVLIALPA